MAVTNQQIKTEFDLFARVWTVYKQYYIPERSEPYWDALVESLKGLQNDFPGQLSVDLSLAILGDIERRFKEQN